LRLPLPPPPDQTQRAEAGGEEWECGGKRNCVREYRIDGHIIEIYPAVKSAGEIIDGQRRRRSIRGEKP